MLDTIHKFFGGPKQSSVFERFISAESSETLKDRIEVSLGIEGGDGVGKAETTLAVLKLLQEAEVIEIDGVEHSMSEYELMYTGYPSYFTPFGHLIYEMNHGGFDRYCNWKDSQDEKIDMHREIRLKMAMYAMDRIFSWIVIEKLARTTGKKLLHVSDRSPYSQLVTIAFVLEKYGETENLDQYLDRIIEADVEFEKTFNWRLATLFKARKNVGVYEDGKSLDDNEGAATQHKVTDAYEAMCRKFGNVSINTQNEEGQYRDGEDIAREVLEKSGIKIKKKKAKHPLQEWFRPAGKYFATQIAIPETADQPPYILGPLATFYFAFSPILTQLVKLKILDRNIFSYLEELNMAWEIGTFSSRQWIGVLGGGMARKDGLAKVEKPFSVIMSGIMEKFGVASDFFADMDPRIQKAVFRLNFDYTRGLLKELVYFLEERPDGKEKFPRGVSRFIDIMMDYIIKK